MFIKVIYIWPKSLRRVLLSLESRKVIRKQKIYFQKPTDSPQSPLIWVWSVVPFMKIFNAKWSKLITKILRRNAYEEIMGERPVDK